jgi:hypothetical protein
MQLFTGTGKLKKVFFWQLEIFDVFTTGDTAHIETIFKFLPHTRQRGCIDILHCCNDPCLRGHVAMVGRTYVKTTIFFSFPVAVKNSIKVGPLVFWL